MTALTKLGLAISVSLLVPACESDIDPVKIDPEPTISFQVEKSNSASDYVSNAISTTAKGKSSEWWQNSDGTILLAKKATFTVDLENGQKVDITIWLKKTESAIEQLTLSDETVFFWERSWDYTTFKGKRQFYYNFDAAYVMVNNNIAYHLKGDKTFKITHVERAVVDGAEKSYVTIVFEGNAFGVYDPSGVFSEVYKITNGVFRGIIE